MSTRKKVSKFLGSNPPVKKTLRNLKHGAQAFAEAHDNKKMLSDVMEPTDVREAWHAKNRAEVKAWYGGNVEERKIQKRAKAAHKATRKATLKARTGKQRDR